MNPPKSAAVRAVVSPVHGRLAIVGITMAVTISIELHLRLAGQVSPVWQTLSEYVYGHFGRVSAAPLFSAMCLALSLGSLALLIGIAKAHREGSASVQALLGTWCAGLAVCGGSPSPWTPGGLRGSGRRVRAVPPAEGQRRPHGERDGRARHAGDGVGRSRRRVAP